MNIIFYRYGSICEPDMIAHFRGLNVDVYELQEEMHNKQLRASERVSLVSRAVENTKPVFVCSINFFPAVADVCQIYGIPYVCWTVDSPVLELFSRSILHKTNRIFLFDRAQYETFHPYNPDCIYHLPLAAYTERFDRVIETITPKESADFAGDITFVGSLYSEKNPLQKAEDMPDYLRGFIDATIDSSLKVYGYNFMEDVLSDSMVAALKKCIPDYYQPAEAICDTDRYVAAHYYIGAQAAVAERVRTLNALAQHFQVELYTRSDTSPLVGVNVHGGVATLTEMPKIFHLSKINLNMTIKPIQTGLPLRIFDIMGCGGFLMTNYQAELTEHFEIGTDLEAYSSLDELLEKCAFYLSHEELRKQIALNGYHKVKEQHTYTNRILSMLRVMS
ncbi:MAG: glycosyltransferase [Lachnospiraceae bacterium]|nr:glycosyltransferase [Lachnospiraceae bacterium]